ncbi:helix-turn-helix domain-containing protein [Paenibacillaceae bacterium WGS1546]|uniref:AraC family transcriptional regulator n=1 Tax=Cohnella sp. WGS1546 TaxID=3366810 RepID=UPI00372D5534
METKPLREERRHGTPQFPFAAYGMDRVRGETILDNHWHDEAEFLWVESGSATFQIGLATYELRAGAGIFVPCGEVHGGYSPTGSACSYKAVVFHLDWLADGQDEISARFFRPLQRGDAAIPAVYDRKTDWGARALRRLDKAYGIFESASQARQLRIKAELMSLFADLIEEGRWTRKDPAAGVDNHTMDRLKAVVAYMERNCGQPLTVAKLADIAGMSAGHFSRVFKAFMRKSPMDYANQYRIRHAAYLLQNTDLSVAETALEVGMGNFSYFSKKFRSVYLCTPSQFRKKFRSL